MTRAELYRKAMKFDDRFDSTDGDDESLKYLNQRRLEPLSHVLEKLIEATEASPCLLRKAAWRSCPINTGGINKDGTPIYQYCSRCKALAELDRAFKTMGVDG